MIPTWLEIIGVFAVIILGILYMIRIIYNYRIGKDIWRTYKKVAESKGLEVKKSLNLLSNWPNLFGILGGKRTYIHPDRGGRKNPAKTIFAVENKIELPSDLIINTPDISKPRDSHELKVEEINKQGLDIYSSRKINEGEIDDLFTKDIVERIDDLIKNNQEDFRALILESGLAMFSKFKIDLDEDSLSENIEKFSDIVADMEQNTGLFNEHLDSPRMSKISEGTKMGQVKFLFPILLLGFSGYLLYNTLQTFSFLSLNAGIIIGAVGMIKLYVTLYTELKF